MFRALFGIAPKLEADGSYSPSKLALKLATADYTDYSPVAYKPFMGEPSRVLVVLTEQKKMTMRNGKDFSTGNHPVETLVPLLHLRQAGFKFEIATPSGKPACLEHWAMPQKDQTVLNLYNDLKPQLETPKSLTSIANELTRDSLDYCAIFIPGGHGAMLGLPESEALGSILNWAHETQTLTISICHGSAALLSTRAGGESFLYNGYEMAVFPDSVDRQTPMLGYLPGQMPWELGVTLKELGTKIINTKADDTCCLDRELVTGASPVAANKLGKLATKTLLSKLNTPQ